MSNFVCPICYKEYDKKTDLCSNCGFEGIEYIDYSNSQSFLGKEKDELFKIYKFSKKVACGKIEYKRSEFSMIDYDDMLIDEIYERRGLAYVHAPNMMLDDGVLALRTEVKSLIADVKGAKSLFLDESHIKMLFLGSSFSTISRGFFIPLSALRYIWVDPKNEYFYADNNVLFNKEQTELICYARMRPEKEYSIPHNVKKIKNYAFFYTKHLKKLYIPKGIQLEERALTFSQDDAPEVFYID